MDKSATAERPRIGGTRAPDHVALIADGELLDQAAAALRNAEVAFDAFATDDELLAGTTSYPPAVVLLVAGGLGSDVIKRIERLVLLPAPLVVICPGIQGRDVRAALTTGVAGVVLASDIPKTLEPCIRAVQAGQICVPREHYRQVEAPALSAREKQILALVVMGYSNNQIADQLFLAESTVKSHLSSAFGKLGVRSRNEAVHLILNPDRGLGMGILALGGAPLESSTAAE